MRRDRLYLQDMIEAADAIAGFIAGISEAEFMASELIRSAVLQKLTIIGEAASRLSPEFRAQHSDVEWADIVAFRNIAVHAYFSVKWDIVWTAAVQDVPILHAQIQRLIDALPSPGATKDAP
jgi:uncharacterized protein with HEPN domain